jgi:hypothetical protein
MKLKKINFTVSCCQHVHTMNSNPYSINLFVYYFYYYFIQLFHNHLPRTKPGQTKKKNHVEEVGKRQI